MRMPLSEAIAKVASVFCRKFPKRAVAVFLAMFPLYAQAADIGAATWSETDASNNSAPPAGWPVNMQPNQVEPTARAMMGATKRWYDHIQPTVTSGGSANAQTLTYAIAPAAYVTGDRYAFIGGATNTGAATLNINSLGAVAVQLNGAALLGGEIKQGRYAEVTYDGANFQIIISQTSRRICNINYSDVSHSTLGDCFLASSNGTEPADDVLRATLAWQRGIDFMGATFATGQAIRLPNNTSLIWRDPGGISDTAALLLDNNTNFQIGVGNIRTNFNGAVTLRSSTVGALPTCNTGTEGYLYVVNDANSPTYNGTLSGGGVSRVLALCNSNVWKAH
jgi:hypothetical protein